MPRAKPTNLERVRALCLALPETSERLTWGDVPTFRVKEKIFVLVESAHAALWCKGRDGLQTALVSSQADAYFVPPYLGGKGWIGARLDAKTDWHALEALIEDSYRLVAPKRLSATLPGLEVAVTSPKRSTRAGPRRNARFDR
jgi:predicted DNA-binding protein (MmcQ/YjbR family)